MSNTEKIKFAIVGAGHIGKRHAEMVNRNEESELVALCDILSQEEAGATDFDVPFFSSIDELLNSDLEIDVINVCTPNGLHAEHSLKALAANKHVVCEKPMALRAAECDEIIARANDNGKQVFCVMQNRYSPPSVWIKEVVDQQLLGDIFAVQLNCFWNRDERYYKSNSWKGKQELDGGTLFTQFSHFIDIMYWLFGDIRDIEGKFEDFNHQTATDFEDSGFVNFRFENGGIGTINYSTSVYETNLESSITIIGSKGSIKIGGQYMNEVEYCNIENYTMPELPPSSPANDYGNYKGSAANHHFLIQNVIDTLKGRATATTNAHEGRQVVAIIEKIYDLRNTQLEKTKKYNTTIEDVR